MRKRPSIAHVLTLLGGLCLASCANSDTGNVTGAGGSTSGEAGTNGRGGLTGSAGVRGTGGTNGPGGGGTTGVAGTTGTAGAAGVVGTSGAAGIGGTAGSGGTNGTAGATGSAGATGAGGGAGRGGATGMAGRGGSTGAAGTSGLAGAGGATATGGAAGTGVAGTTGTAGALIHNDQFWKDTSGTPIYSQGGGVLKVGATTYWYGAKYNGAVTYAANPSRENSDSSFAAVTCYSSTDLVTWKFESNILTAAGLGAMVDSSTWIGRMGVVYNATTKKYVLISQYGGPAGTGEMFATSNTPTGTFTFDHLQTSITNVANTTTGDQTVFIDDDGAAYLICSSSSGRSNLYVAPIRASDSLNIQPATRIFGGAGREGNTMFKFNGTYYFCSSDLHGWNASHSYYIAATNIMGPYGAEGIIGNTDNDFSHVSQTGFFITVQGTAGTTVIFAGDRWSDFAGNGLGYNQWCPLSFSGTTPTMQSVSEWSLNAAAGTWSVGPDNNYALNPSFEADRVAMTQPAGWTTTTTSSGGITPYTNVSGAHTGKWGWQLGTTAAYQATLNQAVTNMPNGTYTLSVWAKSTGGQTAAQLYARGFGAAEKDASLTKAMTAFTQVSITGISVSNGQCQIGVTTTAGANQSVTLDDFELVRTGP
jgi:Glycosyl hydrolases family 43